MEFRNITLITEDGRNYNFRFPDNSLLKASMAEVLLWEILSEMRKLNEPVVVLKEEVKQDNKKIKKK